MTGWLLLWLILTVIIVLYAGISFWLYREEADDHAARTAARALLLAPLWPLVVVAGIGWTVWLAWREAWRRG